ncbi:MAG: sugar phosphate isomerase/epimerase [Saprospiraceae bacterium]
MSLMINRKSFLGSLTGLIGYAATAPHSWPVLSGHPKAPAIQLGLASYTSRDFSLDETIGMAKRVGLMNIALKSMHMPLDATDTEIKSIAQKVRDAGLNLYGAGVIYMKSADEVNNAFRYAQAAGLSIIIGVPDHDLLPIVNDQVKKTNIKVAIHNHGPGDDLYSSVNDVHEQIKGYDARIGFCIDIGHVVRINEDPAAMIRKYHDRLFDLHLKDETTNSAEGTPLEIGRGIIDIPAVLHALQAVGYAGAASIEYEKDGNDPLPGLAESVGYVHGVLRMM